MVHGIEPLRAVTFRDWNCSIILVQLRRTKDNGELRVFRNVRLSKRGIVRIDWRYATRMPAKSCPGLTGLNMLLMIDNYDSFTYNLVQYFGELGEEVMVFRNDEITLDEVARLKPAHIVISPGPCTPNEAGVSVPLIERCSSQIPILGVCLGHQSIGQAFGGKIVHARQLMHGKTSPIFHCNIGVFRGLPNPFTATRYHSLVIERDSLPDCLEITAWTEDGEIMGVRHKTLAIEGVQFHPESILTEHGHKLLENFLER